MQFKCLRSNINRLISLILGGVLALILIAQVDGDIPFQKYYNTDSRIDLRGYVKAQVWFPKRIKYHTVGVNGDHSNETSQTLPDEQPDQPSDGQTIEPPNDQPEEPWGEQPEEPWDEQMDNPPSADQEDDLNGDSGESPQDSTDDLLQLSSHRWPYDCMKGHPEPYNIHEACSSIYGGLCKLCAGGTVLTCCTNITPSEAIRNDSVETIYLEMRNEGAYQIFQNITARIVSIKLMQATIEESAFKGSENIEKLQIKYSNFGHMKRMDLIFEGLYKLKVLNLDDNGITKWDTTYTDTINSDKGLKPLPSLEILSLKRNLFETLGSDFFEWLQDSPLRYLNLEGCKKIVTIDPGVLLPISDSLQILELAYSNINEHNLINILSSNLTKLKSLGLKSIGLHHIPSSSLKMVNSSLEVLSLQKNPLTCISGKCDPSQNEGMQQDIFPHMPKLRELSLADCNIDVFPENIFHNLENLRKLFMQKNSFSLFEQGIFHKLNKLKYLNIRLVASEEKLEIDFSGLNELEILDASYTRLPMSKHVFCSLPNLKELHIKELGVMDHDPAVSKCFTNLEVLDLSGSQVICDHFSEIFKQSMNLTKLVMSGCNYGDLTQKSNYGLIKNLKSLKVLSLDKNKFISIDLLKFIEDLHDLETLNLNQNKLFSWNDYFLSSNLKLKKLFIASNQITVISKGMMRSFIKLDFLHASDNPYLCFCSLTHFRQFAEILSNRTENCSKFCTESNGINHEEISFCLEKCKKNSTYNKDLQQIIDYFNSSFKAEDVNLNILGWNEKTYKCLDNEGRRNIKNLQFENGQCFRGDQLGSITQEEQVMTTWKIVLIALSCTIVLMLGICYWKRRYLYQFGRAVHSVTLLHLLDDENDNPNNVHVNAYSAFSYDVFISYSDPNRQWVLEELVPNFEQGSDLKVCLHERDFQVGLSILENIISCMDHSRIILLVISQAFLRSQWCQFELHMAQHRLLETRREDLVLVLLEEIPTSRRPKMLRYLMLTKTYIQWPGYDAGAEELKLFWKRLRHAVLLPRVMQNQETLA